MIPHRGVMRSTHWPGTLSRNRCHACHAADTLPTDVPIACLAFPDRQASRPPPVVHRRLGRLRGSADYQELADHRLRGREVSADEADRRETKHQAGGRIWCFRINRRWLRDGSVGGNWARFLNHACTPNCYVEIAGDTIWIRAARNIERGEELSIDYNTEGVVGIACRCQPRCKTFL